jgi:hypothetical protein
MRLGARRKETGAAVKRWNGPANLGGGRAFRVAAERKAGTIKAVVEP